MLVIKWTEGSEHRYGGYSLFDGALALCSHANYDTCRSLKISFYSEIEVVILNTEFI